MQPLSIGQLKAIVSRATCSQPTLCHHVVAAISNRMSEDNEVTDEALEAFLALFPHVTHVRR